MFMGLNNQDKSNLSSCEVPFNEEEFLELEASIKQDNKGKVDSLVGIYNGDEKDLVILKQFPKISALTYISEEESRIGPMLENKITKLQKGVAVSYNFHGRYTTGVIDKIYKIQDGYLIYLDKSEDGTIHRLVTKKQY